MKRLLLILLCLNIQLAQANIFLKILTGASSAFAFATSMVGSKECLSQNGNTGFNNASNCKHDLATTALIGLTGFLLCILLIKSILNEKKYKKKSRKVNNQELTAPLPLYSQVNSEGSTDL